MRLVLLFGEMWIRVKQPGRRSYASPLVSHRLRPNRVAKLSQNGCFRRNRVAKLSENGVETVEREISNKPCGAGVLRPAPPGPTAAGRSHLLLRGGPIDCGFACEFERRVQNRRSRFLGWPRGVTLATPLQAKTPPPRRRGNRCSRKVRRRPPWKMPRRAPAGVSRGGPGGITCA